MGFLDDIPEPKPKQYKFLGSANKSTTQEQLDDHEQRIAELEELFTDEEQQEEETIDKKQAAINLRTQGWSFGQIGKRLGVSKTRAFRYCQ